MVSRDLRLRTRRPNIYCGEDFSVDVASRAWERSTNFHLYVGDFNCQHVNWGYNKTSPDRESLDCWATSNNLGLLYDPKETASFSSHRWKVGTNPDLAFASFGQDNWLPDRRVPGKFPRSQRRPSLIRPPRLKVPANSEQVKRWNFCKADWKRSHSWLRWEIATSGHIKHRKGIARFLQDPDVRGQSMHPTWPSEKLCAMLRQWVRDPLSLLHPSSSEDWLWQSRFVPTISATIEEAGPMGGSCHLHRLLAL